MHVPGYVPYDSSCAAVLLCGAARVPHGSHGSDAAGPLSAARGTVRTRPWIVAETALCLSDGLVRRSRRAAGS